MRTPHRKERPKRPHRRSLTKQPSPYQQWRAGAWCVTRHSRKSRRFHRRPVYMDGLKCYDGGPVWVLDYLSQFIMGQS